MEKQSWFAFKDTEQVVYLGEFRTFCAADDAASELTSDLGATVWLFPRSSLEKFKESLEHALKQGVPV